MAGPVTSKSGEIQKREPTKADNLVALVERMMPQIKNALPKHVSPDRMARIAMTAVRQTRDMELCTAPSFVGCVLQAAQLGLEPNTPMGHAYLIPRKNKKLNADQRECTMIIGYQGMIELARRSGMVSSIYAYAVREGDDFEYELGLNPNIRHKPSEDPTREDKPITHVYAVAAMRDSSDRVFVVLSKAKIEAHRKRSGTPDEGPWVTDYEGMALKTAVRQLFKWLPKSAEIARAEALDDAADLGAQATAIDPTVAAALTKGGLIEDAEIIDPQTGEVTKSNGNGEAKAS